MSDRITAQYVRELFDYDASIGGLTRKISRGRGIGTRAGTTTSGGYRHIQIDRKMYGEHRLIWLHCYGDWPTEVIDHIDGDPSNNRIENLRDVSVQTNSQNQKQAHKDSTSRLLGVSLSKVNKSRPWTAAIMFEGKRKYLGYFSSPEEAHEAYLQAKRELHSGNTL